MSTPDAVSGSHDEHPATSGRDYAQRLQSLGSARWKQVLNVQAPYRAHLRRLRLGRTLDVGCGTGRNLVALDGGSMGVDHNPFSIELARTRGLDAWTSEEFFQGRAAVAEHDFDSMLVAHVVEHMSPGAAHTILASYLPFVRPGGQVVFITPQERGYATDPTHVTFTDFTALERLAADLHLVVDRRYSFPFPRPVGRVFAYNEFVVRAHKPA